MFDFQSWAFGVCGSAVEVKSYFQAKMTKETAYFLDTPDENPQPLTNNNQPPVKITLITIINRKCIFQPCKKTEKPQVGSSVSQH